MGFTIHVAFHIWGHVFLIIGYLGLVSFHFCYLITSAYVTSRVLRPPWGRGIRYRLRQPLLGQVFVIWLTFRYHHVSYSGSRLWCVGLIQLCSDYRDREFDDDWLGVTWFFWRIVPLVPHYSISHFIWRFMDPHRSAQSLSLTGCSLRCGHGRYLTEPLRSIQLVPHFLTLGCHHASPSGRSSWIYVHDSVMDSDDQYYMFDDRWLHVMLFFGPVAHLMPY